MVKLLLSSGTDPYVTNEDGHRASALAATEPIEILLRKAEILAEKRGVTMTTAPPVVMEAEEGENGEEEDSGILVRISSKALYVLCYRCLHKATKKRVVFLVSGRVVNKGR